MHHDPKLTAPREPAFADPHDPDRGPSRANGVVRPRAHRGIGTFAGWGPKLG